MTHRMKLAHAAFVSVGFALAVAAAIPRAAADPTNDWPYDQAQLPGFPDPATVTDVHSEFLGLGTLTTENVVYVSDIEGTPLYSVANSILDSPSLQFHNDYAEVTEVLDDSAGYPSVGTVADHTTLFSVPPSVAGNVPLIINNYIDDPNLGTADEFSAAFGSIDNMYLSDAAGTQDILTLFGHSFTLFDFPAVDAPTDAASSLSQLFDEFATLF